MQTYEWSTMGSSLLNLTLSKCPNGCHSTLKYKMFFLLWVITRLFHYVVAVDNVVWPSIVDHAHQPLTMPSLRDMDTISFNVFDLKFSFRNLPCQTPARTWKLTLRLWHHIFGGGVGGVLWEGGRLFVPRRQGSVREVGHFCIWDCKSKLREKKKLTALGHF